jgi:hypothetical protein
MNDSKGKQHFNEITPYRLPFVSDMSEKEKNSSGEMIK